MRTIAVDQSTMERRSRALPSDEDLFEAFVGGDEAAFTTVFTRYQNRVYNFCCRIIGDRDRAGDAFQDTFLRVVQYRKSYRRTERFDCWLFAVARNACRNVLMKEARYEDLDADGFEPIAEATGEELDFTEREAIAAAIRRLPPLLREAILLYEYEGFTYNEIAEMTHASMSAVKLRIFRARAGLRAMLRPIFRREGDKETS